MILIFSTVIWIHEKYGDEFFHRCEFYFLVLFTTEYICRLWVCNVLGEKRRKWIFKSMNLIDLCAILPNYVMYITLACQTGPHDHDHSHRILAHERTCIQI